MLKNIKYEHKVQEIKQIISDEDLFNRKKECASLQEEIKGYMNSQKYEWQGLKVYYSPVLDTCMYTFKSKINWDETWHHSWMLYDYLNGNERIFGGTGCQSIYEVGFEEECRKAEEEMDIIINQYTKNDNSYPEITWMSIGKKTDGRNVVNWSFEDGRYKSAWNCYNECKMIVKDSNFLGKALFSEDMPTPNGCDTWFNVSKDNSKLMNNISNICINIQCINGKQTREFCFGKK